ncbi:hypothetical protein M378DRAFT_173573 [Amanita muscaria Koide BX008]|uniref:Uncharacterized protein n=1 Tax=Amanita muscaria (strain Koide BX008) TaxID=946122 RepID=A0A0C2WG11_AMAMK|nr:hypothetical protein M378DRAFT_173573 [Amanita muscaria Koide BX008]
MDWNWIGGLADTGMMDSNGTDDRLVGVEALTVVALAIIAAPEPGMELGPWGESGSCIIAWLPECGP